MRTILSFFVIMTHCYNYNYAMGLWKFLIFKTILELIKFNEGKDYDLIEEKIIDAYSGCCILCAILISLLIILGSIIGIWIYFALVSNHQLWLCMFQ